MLSREHTEWVRRPSSRPGQDIYYHRPTGSMFREKPGDLIDEATVFSSPEFLPVAPLRAYFDFTYRCNLECKHCITDSSPHVDTSTELSTERICELIGELAAIGVLEIQTSGGEPFIHPDWETLFHAVTSTGANLIVTTNGLLLRPPVVRRLKAIAPTEIRVSFDGGPELHDHVRGAGTYRRAMRGLADLAQAGFNTSVRFTLCGQDAEDELPVLFADIASAGARRIKVAIVKETGRAATDSGAHLLRPLPEDETVQMLHDLGAKQSLEVQLSADDFPVDFEDAHDPKLREQERPNCGAGFETAYISPRGDLLSCVAIPDHGFGTLHSASFLDTWRGKFAQKFRQDAAETTGRRLCDSLCGAGSSADDGPTLVPISSIGIRKG